MMSFRVRVLLSVQRAMWDLVTPNLRAVAVAAQEPNIRLRFMFENDPSEDDHENVSLAETYVIADFEDSVSVDATCVWLPVPVSRDLDIGEEWVYMRKESD
ncbi:hypothetical protein [Agromyces silvae]|uniref:hypothetical protein n=1 Tax=Agromyces silvae TaxID=3388266 RepID=UPI00280AE718|nr:hypothetical protein [Agromyces protaetiae]